MTCKILEIRDRGTFIPMLAIKAEADHHSSEARRWLLAKAGYGITPDEQAEYVLLAQINGGNGKIACDPYDWGQNPRTYFVAHQWIIEHWNELKDGDVVCVEYALGERAEPKQSDRYARMEA